MYTIYVYYICLLYMYTIYTILLYMYTIKVYYICILYIYTHFAHFSFACTNLTPMAQDVIRSLLSLSSRGMPSPRLVAGEADGRRLPSMREDVPEGRVSWW